MSKIIILGAGAMGSAFSLPCVDNNHETIIAGTHLDNKFIEYINHNDNFHPTLNVKLSNKIKFIKDKDLLNNKYHSASLIVIATNSKGLDWSVEKLNLICKSKELPPILLLTKGLSVYNNKFEILAEKLERILILQGFQNINISAVGGPCLASDLANKIHSCVIIANKDLKTANWLKQLLKTNYYHVFVTDDIVGVEISAAIKNIFSMVIGSAKVMSYLSENHNNNTKYLNTSAALFNQCVYEMELFVSSLNGKKETVKGLAGIGDLYVSAAGGRNSLMGSYLGEGFFYAEVKNNQMKNITIEGAELAFEIFELVSKHFNVKQMPLMFSMMDAIINNKKLEINWNYFN